MDFFYKYKKFFFVVLFLLFSGFLGLIMFSVFFGSPIKPTKAPPITTGPGGSLPGAIDGEGNIITPGTGGELPATKDPSPIPGTAVNQTILGGLTKTTALTTANTSNQSKNKDGSSLNYYNEDDGKFYKIDNQGNAVTLSDKVFYSVENVSWANNNDKAVIEYPDGANIVYDFEKEEQITLPKHWEAFEFSNNDNQIVAKSIGLDPKNRWLTIANSDGSNAKKIEPLGNNGDKVYTSWSPNNQTVAMFADGLDLNRQTLYFIGQNSENFKSTIVEGRGFDPLWSPDGSTLVYSVYSSKTDMNPSLWVVAAQGDNIGANRRSLGVETWANKCTFESNNTVYCAVPQGLQKGSGLFKDLANTTNDVIYKINIFNGTKRIFAIPDSAYTISNIIISDDSKTLFFTDKRTNSIQKIDL